jgi:hypothetical protein
VLLLFCLWHLPRTRARTSHWPQTTPSSSSSPRRLPVLLREPGLGRAAGPAAAAFGRARPKVGRRYFRIRSAALGRPKRARLLARRLLVVMEPSRRRLSVQLRLSERQALQLLALLQPSSPGTKRDLPSVLAALRQLYEPRLPEILAARMMRHAQAKDAADAAVPVDALLKALAAALSKFLTQRAAQLAAAVAEPASGVTLSITFQDLTKEKLGGTVQPPEVAVHAGWKPSGQ